MNGLQTARVAIEAELNHARAGMAHYQALVAKLEATLATVSALAGAPVASVTTKSKPARMATASKKRVGRPAKRRAATEAVSGELPFTGGDFWINLITAQPVTARDILKSAVASLGFTPSREQVKKLSNRMIFTLRTLVASKKIQDSGAGRERRYSRNG